MKKTTVYFVVIDKYHVKPAAYYVVYGTEHQVVQFQYMMMKKYADENDRTFNPFEEFKPYDWNHNTVYSNIITYDYKPESFEQVIDLTEGL